MFLLEETHVVPVYRTVLDVSAPVWKLRGILSLSAKFYHWKKICNFQSCLFQTLYSSSLETKSEWRMHANIFYHELIFDDTSLKVFSRNIATVSYPCIASARKGEIWRLTKINAWYKLIFMKQRQLKMSFKLK